MKKRFYIQILVVALAAMLSSSLYYYSICNGLRSTKEAVPGKLNQILYDTAHYDAVFAGSSRVLKNINPLQFDSLTHIRSYNAGIDGANLTLIDILLRRFIQVHHPSLVYINLDTYTMESDSSFFYFPQLFPHVRTDEMSALIHTEPKLSLGRRYPFLALSYMDDYLKGVAFHTLFDPYPACDTLYCHNGFAPIVSTEYQGTSEKYTLRFVYTKEGFKKFDSLCDYCTRQHCKVIFIMAPMFNATGFGSNASGFYTLLREIESKYGIRELNFYTDTRFTKDQFFNMTHLNEKGAVYYTKVLADSFKVIEPISQISSPIPQVNEAR